MNKPNMNGAKTVNQPVPLTVSELITILQTKLPDLPVVDIDCYPISEVRDDKAAFEDDNRVSVIRLL